MPEMQEHFPALATDGRPKPTDQSLLRSSLLLMVFKPSRYPCLSLCIGAAWLRKRNTERSEPRITYSR